MNCRSIRRRSTERRSRRSCQPPSGWKLHIPLQAIFTGPCHALQRSKVSAPAAIGEDALHVLEAVGEVDRFERTGFAPRLGADRDVQQVELVEVADVGREVDDSPRLEQGPDLPHARLQGVAEFAFQRHVGRVQPQQQFVALGRVRRACRRRSRGSCRCSLPGCGPTSCRRSFPVRREHSRWHRENDRSAARSGWPGAADADGSAPRGFRGRARTSKPMVPFRSIERASDWARGGRALSSFSSMGNSSLADPQPARGTVARDCGSRPRCGPTGSR